MTIGLNVCDSCQMCESCLIRASNGEGCYSTTSISFNVFDGKVLVVLTHKVNSWSVQHSFCKNSSASLLNEDGELMMVWIMNMALMITVPISSGSSLVTFFSKLCSNLAFSVFLRLPSRWERDRGTGGNWNLENFSNSILHCA